jgi:hypothetical protein
MSLDPRLADMTVLVLAAKRRLATRQAPDWRTSVGMSSLLEAARSLPRREPFALPSVEDCDGLARLLAEARQWEEDRHGA